MKNFLTSENLILEDKDSISNFIQSSSEVSECSITNVLEENSSTIWISNEELPQEITINLSRSFLKEYPKKLTAIGIYCWHAYPTNPKLVEILISKNNDNNFISFGNFDLCLKPGKQLLQLDENDSNILITENNNYIIKIIIKETYGDKRTYINNIYLYENIDVISNGKNINNTIDTIKEEDDSSSVFYLRESRERTLPRKKKLSNNNIQNTRLNKEINNIINDYNNNHQKESNNPTKVNDELNNKDLTISEFEIITKTKVKENKNNEKNVNNNNKSINNNLNINNTYDNDESNINTNNNILGAEFQFNGTYSEFSEKNNNINNIIKNDEIGNKNILLTKTNDNVDEELNNSNKNNISENKINEENTKNESNNNNKKSSNNIESFDGSLSSEDLESFGILKGTKTHQKNFFNPPKISDTNEELDTNEFQHSSSGFKFKTKNDIINKNFAENYFNMQNSYNNNKKSSKNTLINSNNNNNANNNSQNSNKNIIKKKSSNSNVKESNYNKNQEDINKLKEEMNSLKNEFNNYKKGQEEIIKQYQNKITNLESHIKKLQINSNKMNDVVKTLLEAQYIQNQTNNDYLLNQMKKIASETFVNIFSNVSQLANLMPTNTPSITIQNQNQGRQTLLPFNDNIIYMNEDRTKQQTYQTTRRKMYSIDKITKQQNNYNTTNDIINNNINNNQTNGIKTIYNNIYNKKINDDLNIKANKLKKYNSGRNIVLRKNYINKNQTNYINFDNNQKNYKTNNNETIENNDNIEEPQRNGNLFFQTGYPNEINKNPFKKIKNINNINQNEILRINNNNFDNNILNNKKELIHKRIISNTYKKKNFSPIKRIKHSYIVYTDTDHLFPETTANISNQNKNINFNYNINNNSNSNNNNINNENEENEEELEISSNDDAPLKVSQLKTEKRNFNFNKIIHNKDNNDEEKDNENETENKANSETGDTLNNLRNKLGEKLNEENKKATINKNLNYSKGKINDENEKQTNNININKDIINKKNKINMRNEPLINLIHKYNSNKMKDKESNE